MSGVSGGLLVGVGGVWVLFQVLGGNALGRLGIIDTSGASPATSSAPAAVSTTGGGGAAAPATGVPA